MIFPQLHGPVQAVSGSLISPPVFVCQPFRLCTDVNVEVSREGVRSRLSQVAADLTGVLPDHGHQGASTR